MPGFFVRYMGYLGFLICLQVVSKVDVHKGSSELLICLQVFCRVINVWQGFSRILDFSQVISMVLDALQGFYMFSRDLYLFTSGF